MPTLRRSIACLLIWAGISLPLTSRAAGADTLAFGGLVGRLAPSVVGITGYMGQATDFPYVQASGFFITEDGFLVTVPDVFTDRQRRRLCQRFVIKLFDGRLIEAKVFSVDPVLNLAILKVTEPGPYPFANTERGILVRPGDRVLAMSGWTTGESDPFTLGYVTAKEKKSIYGSGFGDMLINGRIPLAPHAYGGPLANDKGDVIGILTRNVHIASPQAEDPDDAHALPMNIAMGFFRVARAYPTSQQNWIGLSVRPLDADQKASAYKILGKTAGLYVDFVWADGPAAQTDIHPGDILFEMNGKALTDIHELNKLLLATAAGVPVDLAILREGRGYVRRITAEARPAWAGYGG
jgi:serine protease Do